MVFLPNISLFTSDREHYLNEVHQEGRLKHPVQFDIVIMQQIFQATTGTVLRHYSKDPTVMKEAQERVNVLMPHVFHLQMKM